MQKIDHYVAQTYLRAFVDDEGFLTPYYKNGHVVIGKKKSPKQVCYEADGDANLYFDNPRILDEYLRHIENPWTNNVAMLASGNVDADCKYEIGAYIAFLRSCTPTAKRLGAKGMSAIMQPLVDKTCAAHFHELGDTTDKVRFKIKKLIRKQSIHAVVDEEYVHAIAIQNLIKVTYRYYCSHWMVLVNETGIPFIASDNPASLYYTEKNSRFATIFTPLSPTLAMLIRPDLNFYRPTIDDVKNYTHPYDGYMHPKESFVKMLNEIAVKCAENIVLHSKEEEWVESLVSKYKDWRVNNKTFKFAHENETMIFNKQIASKNA